VLTVYQSCRTISVLPDACSGITCYIRWCAEKPGIGLRNQPSRPPPQIPTFLVSRLELIRHGGTTAGAVDTASVRQKSPFPSLPGSSANASSPAQPLQHPSTSSSSPSSFSSPTTAFAPHRPSPSPKAHLRSSSGPTPPEPY